MEVRDDKWQIRFNATKCKVMYIAKDNINCSYIMKQDSKDIILQQSHIEKDLSVFINKGFNFNHSME